MFSCDDISDHAGWNEVFHYRDTKLSWDHPHSVPFSCIHFHQRCFQFQFKYVKISILFIFNPHVHLCLHLNFNFRYYMMPPDTVYFSSLRHPLTQLKSHLHYKYVTHWTFFVEYISTSREKKMGKMLSICLIFP